MTQVIYRLQFKGGFLSNVTALKLSALRKYVKSVEHMSDDQLIRLENNALEIHTEPDAQTTDPRDEFPRDSLGRFTKRK